MCIPRFSLPSLSFLESLIECTYNRATPRPRRRRMTKKRYSWQIVAVAAISVIGNSFLAYYLLFGLAGDGVAVTGISGRTVVTAVWKDTPADRAGLLEGDVLREVDGQRIGNVVDWLAQRMNFQEDKPIRIHLERAGQPMDLTMVIHGNLWHENDQSTKTSQII